MNNGKSKFLAILLFAISLISMSLFGISCKKPQESADNGVAKEATYYCATEENNFVTLTKAKTYVLSIAGEQKTGDYALSESGELKLTVDSGEVTATIKSDELAITYGGKSYTLIEQIDRSVTFNDDGATTTATVLNGKSVAKPADPEEKEGKKFVGWYTSEEYKEVYNFATPVRSDITVYAQHVKLTAGAKEFTVTLKDGSNEKLQTTNGIVYGLEQLAAKDGAEFDGWYVSDFNDEAKLTYKYNGEVLKENVNLYPVWKGEISGVSVTESKISWEADGTSFDVKITDADNVSETKRATQKYLDYDFKNVGEYKIEIGKTGSDKTTTVYYNSKVLARVSNITVVEGGIVSYNTVENAEKYIVTVECGNENHKHTDVDNGKRAYFDISGCDMKEGGIKVIIVAQAKDYGSSQSEAFYYDRTLDKIAAVEVKDGKLVWSEVKNALGYVVVVNGEKIELDNVTEYSLKGYAAGDYALEVYPVTKGYNSPAAATTTYKKEKLATPAGVAVNGNFLKWESVAGATSYTVKLNGKTFTSDKNEAELNAEDIKTENTVTITAIGDGVQSEESDVFVFAQGKMSELAYADGKVEWQGIFGAQTYIIKLNGNLLATVAGDVTSYKVAYKIAGENKITVGYANEEDATETVDEAAITVTVYTVSFIGDDGENLGSVLVAEGDPIDAPVVEKAGFVFAGWYKVPDGSKNNAQKYTGGKLETAGDVRFYADFDTAKYKVTLNADADPDKQIEDIVAFKQYFTLKTVEPEDENMAFGGWYTEPGGQGKQITDHLGNGIGKWTYAYDGVKLYAKWLNLFSFTYNDQGFIVTGAEGLQYVASAKVPENHFDGQHNAKVITVDELEYGENLVSIDIPDTVTTIQTGAKLGIESSAFKACKSLKAINIYKTGKAAASGYASFDGILYEAVYTRDSAGNEKLSSLNLLLVPYAKDGDIVVADETSSIATYAFAKTAVGTVTLPASVVEVKDYAFSAMTQLTEVTFLGSDANKQVTLGEGVFASDSKLIKVTLPAGLKASTHHVKEWSTGYEDQSLGEGIKTVIYEYDIDFDTFLFNKSTKLQTIEVNGNGGYYKSVDGMLCKADGTIVYCPKGREKAVVTTNEITAIGDGAFKDCNNIESVTINAGVTYIGFEAFYCTYSGGFLVNKLTDLNFNTDENDAELVIAERAFYNQKIMKLTLPANLVELGKYAFGNTVNLKSVTVESVGKNGELVFADDAFATRRNDNYLPEYYVETVVIGKNVPAIGISAVFGPSLKNVTIDKDNANYDTTDNNIYYSKDGKKVIFANVNAISGEVVLRSGVEVIGANVFANATLLTAINIPASVKVIGDGAFRNSGLATVVFETSGTAATSLDIGKQAFYKCKLSGSLVLPERLKTIGEAAFKELGITEFKFTGTNLTTIGARAFESCSITTITFNEGLTTIGKEAFYNCKKLETINLPSTVTDIGSNFVGNCESIIGVNVDEDCVDYSTNQGVLYKNKKYKNELNEDVYIPSELVLCPTANDGDNGTLTIPKTVTIVNDNAFSDNQGIEHIIFEDYDEEYMKNNELVLGSGTVSQYIFDGSKVKTIKLPRGLVTIKSYSLTAGVVGSVKLEEIFIPNTVRTIESYSMSNLTSLTKLTFEAGNDDLPLEIADGTSVYNSAFGGCTALATVDLPARTTKIGAYAFYLTGKNNNDKFTTVNIPAKVQEIGDYAFANRCKLNKVTISDTTEAPSQLTKIGQYAFLADTALTSVALPSALDEIGLAAFSTSGLTGVTIPASVTTIGRGAFEKCTSLASVKFEETQKSLVIGVNAFNGCTKLATLELSEGLTTIGANAFTSAIIKNVTIPSTVTTIGEQAFKDSSLGGDNGKVTFALDGNDKSSLKSIGKEAFGGTKLAEFVFPETVDTLTLGDNLFQSCMSLTKITISSSVKSLGNALGGATEISEIILSVGGGIKSENGLVTNGKDAIYAVLGEPELENGTLVIPEGITTIGDKVFEGFTNIKTVVLPSTIMSIGKQAFANCIGLEKVAFTNGAPSLFEISGRTFENCVSLKSIDLPVNLETISYYAFANSGLESIKIPATVSTLGGIETNKYVGNSFDSCKSLKSVTFAKNGDLKTLTEKTFLNCTALESVTLPDGLEEIQTQAFANTKLASVNIGAVVTTIGSSAFSGVTSLTSVTFANNGSLNTIDSSAFANTGLTRVELPETLTTLGSSAFKNCGNLESVTFKGKLITTINASAFAETALTSITIPDSVTVIKDSVFQNCTALTEVKLSSKLEILGSIVSSTSSADKGYVFDGCTSLESITLPESLTYIGSYTFNNTGLRSITIPGKVENLTIKNKEFSALSSKFQLGGSKGSIDTASLAGQFANCAELMEVILPITLKSIGAGVFYNTPKLSVVKYDGGADNELPASVTAIGGFAFANSGLKTLTAKGLSEIYTNSFMMSEFTSVDLEKSPAAIVRTYAFTNTETLTSVKLPETVTTIEDSAFEGSGIQNPIIPDTLTIIGKAAFKNSGLKSITLRNVTSFGANVFEGCKDLAQVTLSSELQSLSASMFMNCSSLTNFTIPSNVVSIADDCLFGTGITSLTLPAKLTAVGVGALSSSKLTTVTISDDNKSFKVQNNFLVTTAGKIVAYVGNETEVTLPDSASSLSAGIFAGNDAIEKLIVPGSITTLTANMFYNCKATEIVLNEGTTTIAANAFKGCTNLTKLVLPSSITSLANGTFNGVGDRTNPQLVLDLSKISIDVAKAPMRILGTCAAKNVILPDEWTAIPNQMFWGTYFVEVHLPNNLTAIGASAFKGSSWDSILEKIEIPANVETIGSSAFEDCVKLKSVKFLGNKVKTIGSSAFKSCQSLIDIELPEGITEIGASAFTGKYIAPSTKPYMGAAFTSITLPASVKTIGASAFQYCRNLETVVAKGTITSIGNNAFAECESLKNIDLSHVTSFGTSALTYTQIESLQLQGNATYGKTAFQYNTKLKTVEFTDGSATLSDSMFIGCSALTTVKLPTKITAISASLFSGCSSLTQVEIPETVTSIGEYAFNGCSLLTTISISDNVTSIGKYAFQNCTSVKSIFIPKSVTTFGKDNYGYLYPVFDGWTSAQTINFEFEGYKVFKLYGSTWMQNNAAKVNFGVTR